MNAWLVASRPKTWIASLSPVCIGTALAVSDRSFQWWIFLCTLLVALGIQIATNMANDLFDYLKGADTIERKGPVRVMQSGMMTIKEIKIATASIMSLTFLIGLPLIYRGGMVIALLLACAILFAIAYTAGPFPLAYLGIADLFVLVFFGPVASGMTYYLQTLHFSAKAFAVGIAPGLLSSALLTINNLRDLQEDQKANKRTLVVRLGSHFGKIQYSFSLVMASIFPLFFYDRHHLPQLGVICLLPSLFLIKKVGGNRDPYAYNPLLEKTGELLFLYTFIFSVGILA